MLQRLYPKPLLLQAVLRGMSFGLSIKEPFLVINGGVLAWNTYLPIMHQHRYAELLKMLEPAVDMLLQVSDGAGQVWERGRVPKGLIVESEYQLVAVGKVSPTVNAQQANTGDCMYCVHVC